MFEQLKRFFTDDEAQADENLSMELATAALLIEVSKSDYEQDADEVAKIRRLLMRHFSLSQAEIDSFMDNAQQLNQDSTSLYPFTRFINDNCSNQEKYRLVLALWEVAAEDGSIDKYEEHLIRKIADLIYLPHTDFIRAKLSVIENMNNIE